MQISADAVHAFTAPPQPNLSISTPVPAPERTEPKYPNDPTNPVAAAATFFELDSIAHSPPINTCGPYEQNPIMPI